MEIKEISRLRKKLINGSFKTPMDLNEYLNKFKYGLVDLTTGEINPSPSEYDFYHKYRVLSPEQFIEYKAGVCWDFVVFEYVHFSEHFPSYRLKAFFAEDEYKQSHTWLTYGDFRNTYIFESSWKKEMGITSFENEDEMIFFYEKKLRESWKKDISDSSEFHICEYDPRDTIGLNCQQFLDLMSTHLCLI